MKRYKFDAIGFEVTRRCNLACQHSLKKNDLATYCELVSEMRQAQPIKQMPPLLPETYEEVDSEQLAG